MDSQTYSDTADELTNRILKLIPDHSEILTLENPFDLFKIEGFKCDDLQPSLIQAQWAIAKAKELYNKPLDSDPEKQGQVISNVMRQLYKYHWGNNPVRKRFKGRECFILAVGKRNSALIEFIDNHERILTSRRAIRRITSRST